MFKSICLSCVVVAAVFGDDMPFYAAGTEPVMPAPVGRVVSTTAAPVDSRLPVTPVLSAPFAGVFRTNKSSACHIFIR